MFYGPGVCGADRLPLTGTRKSASVGGGGGLTSGVGKTMFVCGSRIGPG